MPNLKIEQLAAGMILKSGVFNMHHQLLLGAGCEIQPKHLALLRAWGVSAVDVYDSDHLATEELRLDPAELAKAKERIHTVLQRQNLQSPIIAELVEACALRQCRPHSPDAR